VTASAQANCLASPAEGIRARLSMIRLLAEWEQAFTVLEGTDAGA